MEQEYSDFLESASSALESEYARRLLLQIESQGTDSDNVWSAAAALFRTCFSGSISIPPWVKVVFVFFILFYILTICENAIRSRGIYMALKYVLHMLFAATVALSLCETLSTVSVYMRDTTAFLGVLAPTVGILTASGGNVATATASSVTLSVFLTLAQFILQQIIPFVFSFFCGLAILDAVSGNEKLLSLSKAIKNILFLSFSILTAIFFIIISYQNIAAANTDTISAKALRLLVSNAVPIIGGTIGEALKLVGGTLVSLKNTVGLAAVFFLLLMYLPVLITLFGNGVLMNVLMFICEYFSFAEAKATFFHIKSALDFALAAFTAVIVIGILNVGIFMQALPTVFAL